MALTALPQRIVVGDVRPSCQSPGGSRTTSLRLWRMCDRATSVFHSMQITPSAGIADEEAVVEYPCTQRVVWTDQMHAALEGVVRNGRASIVVESHGDSGLRLSLLVTCAQASVPKFLSILPRSMTVDGSRPRAHRLRNYPAVPLMVICVFRMISSGSTFRDCSNAAAVGRGVQSDGAVRNLVVDRRCVGIDGDSTSKLLNPLERVCGVNSPG